MVKYLLAYVAVVMTGRPATKFIPEITERIINDIYDGIPYKIAAESNGISEQCLYRWIKEGMKDLEAGENTDHSIFVESLRNIEKSRIKNNIEKIRKGKKGHKGCEWELERSFWRYFSSHAQNIEINERIESLEKSKENK